MLCGGQGNCQLAITRYVRGRRRAALGDEDRMLLLLGCSRTGTLLVVAHDERGGGIRLISARRANRRERKDHEESTD
jgi:uncharacterized DUF497 family protein